MKNKLLLIDGHSILNRAFYGLPLLTNSKGLNTNAVYGFLNIMFKILDDEEADHIAVAFDLNKPTFRHKVYEDYKGTRKKMPEELREQIPVIKELLGAMNIPIFEIEGYEADDILGTLAKKFASEDIEVSLLSGDRDLLQISDEYIKIKIPKTIKGRTVVKDYFPKDVEDEYGVNPKQFIDYKALIGDASDNIPGVKSVGEKTALKILQQFGSIEEAIENYDKLKPEKLGLLLKNDEENAKFCKFLVTINTEVPLECNFEDMYVENIYNKDSLSIIKELEFSSFLSRFDKQILNENNSKKIGNISYKLVTKKEEISGIKIGKEIGLEVIKQNKDIAALSLCVNGTEAYTIVNDDIIEILKSIVGKAERVYTFDLKSIVKELDLEYSDNKTKFIDLTIAAYLINPIKDNYNVHNIANEYLEFCIDDFNDVFKKKNIKEELVEKFDKNSIECCCNIALTSLNVNKIILDKLNEMGMHDLYFDIELPLIYSLAKMEKTGISVDEDKLDKYADEVDELIKKISEDIYNCVGFEFNINSQKQLGKILFEDLGIEGGKKTKTGYSTSADILEKIADKHEVIPKILEYRKFTKLSSTYLRGLKEYIEGDGRIRSTFNQTITATGRISSTDPNLQNIPVRTAEGMKIRDIFVSKDGYSFVDADYSQIELRILAVLSNDEKLIKSYKSGKDIHKITASQVFGVPLEEVSSAQRRNAKAVNFGVVYGISAFGLSEDLSISRQEAKEYINNYFATYEKVKDYLDNCVKTAKEKGYTKTMFGRIRPVPEIQSSNFMVRSFGDRIAMNSPIQGSAADIMKMAMIKVDEALKYKGYDARIVLQIHDELLIECRDDIKEEVKALVVDVMKNAVSLSVDLEVEANIGKTWLQAK